MNTLSVDPGLHACGVAVWDDRNQLLWAGYVKNPNGVEFYSMVTAVCVSSNKHACAATKLVIELPQVYVRTRSKGDPNDLISLSVLVGAFVGRFGGSDPFGYKLYKPQEWKGQVPKDIMSARIASRLTDEERSKVVLPAAGLAHNVWDGVGLGLHHAGRLR